MDTCLHLLKIEEVAGRWIKLHHMDGAYGMHGSGGK
jgi:hypothetical protein